MQLSHQLCIYCLYGIVNTTWLVVLSCYQPLVARSKLLLIAQRVFVKTFFFIPSQAISSFLFCLFYSFV